MDINELKSYASIVELAVFEYEKNQHLGGLVAVIESFAHEKGGDELLGVVLPFYSLLAEIDADIADRGYVKSDSEKIQISKATADLLSTLRSLMKSM